jgi:hypothetical protein
MSALPRLLANTLKRERLEAWFTSNTSVPLRLLIAPTGFGKTTVLASYASTRENSVVFTSLRRETNADELLTLLGDGLGLRNPSYDEMFRALEARQPCECILDGLEWLTHDAAALVERLCCEVPQNIGIIAAGVRTNIDVARYTLRGFAMLMPSELLLFTSEELEELADRYELNRTVEQLEELRERTDGWALVVSDILRMARDTHIDIQEAYPRWMKNRGEDFSHLLQDEMARATERTRDALAAMVGGLTTQEVSAERLILDGAPIIQELGFPRVLRVVIALQPPAPITPPSYDEPLRVRMFGRFSVRVAEREVQWVRRRDQQVIRYILLRPDGIASKTEITELFWPDADPQLAAQSLRTACSNIRKALATSLGAEYVDRFFRVESAQLRVCLDDAVIDVQRFKAHINAAQEAEVENDFPSLLAHVAAAERMYKADLFAGEPLEIWFAPQREAYREMRAYAVNLRTRLRVDMHVAETTRSGEE